MDTPICDFVAAYEQAHPLRLHMPGHKGKARLGPESRDITEIAGADELYHAHGIIQRSEENASSLFGTQKTLYSTEGSSLCIRAMVYLALLWARKEGKAPLILAGRNAHKTFLSACALLGADVRWLYPEGKGSLISCEITASGLEKALSTVGDTPAAVYITSPDYLGNVADVAALSQVCRRHGTLLLTDNAHGAYLRFLPKDGHPISLGADLCCDSAHKTLPALTGGAYLHIGKNAPPACAENAERALALFASTSPSYLILQSLDQCNAYLAGNYREKLQNLADRTEAMKRRLRRQGYDLVGSEPIKLTLAPKGYGYTGDALHDLLRAQQMECEFSDPDYLTAMLTPDLEAADLDRLENALLAIPRKRPLLAPPPLPPHPERAVSIREAMLAPARRLPVEEALGRVLAEAQVGCPPCIPIIMSGERIDRETVACFRYYGIGECSVMDE